mgnify:CR=1 FL=1
MADLKHFTPDVFIAGSFQHKGHDPLEAAYHNASYALDDEDIRLVVSSDKENVYFLAAHGKDFIGHEGCGTTLANALPGIAGHKAEGVYITTSGSLCMCIAVSNQGISAFTSPPEGMRGYASLHKLPSIDTEDMKAVEWIGYRTETLSDLRTFSDRSIKYGSFCVFFFSLLWIALSFLVGYYSNNVDGIKQKLQVNAKQVATALNTNVAHPAEIFLAEIQKIGSVAAKNKGNIDVYRVEADKVTWEIRLPDWVPASEYQHLGNVTVAHEGKKIIRVKKE